MYKIHIFWESVHVHTAINCYKSTNQKKKKNCYKSISSIDCLLKQTMNLMET